MDAERARLLLLCGRETRPPGSSLGGSPGNSALGSVGLSTSSKGPSAGLAGRGLKVPECSVAWDMVNQLWCAGGRARGELMISFPMARDGWGRWLRLVRALCRLCRRQARKQMKRQMKTAGPPTPAPTPAPMAAEFLDDLAAAEGVAADADCAAIDAEDVLDAVAGAGFVLVVDAWLLLTECEDVEAPRGAAIADDVDVAGLAVMVELALLRVRSFIGDSQQQPVPSISQQKKCSPAVPPLLPLH